MERKRELTIVTEKDLSLTTRLMLIINRKRIKLNSMKMESNYSSDSYKYSFKLSGDIHMLQQLEKVMSKQIGVLDVKLNIIKYSSKSEMAMA